MPRAPGVPTSSPPAAFTPLFRRRCPFLSTTCHILFSSFLDTSHRLYSFEGIQRRRYQVRNFLCFVFENATCSRCPYFVTACGTYTPFPSQMSLPEHHLRHPLLFIPTLAQVWGVDGAGVEKGWGPAPRKWLLRATVAQVITPKSYLRRKSVIPAPLPKDTCA